MRTIGLLLLSNVFMTIAWYGHLRHKSSALWVAILVSWMIALPEYMLQVPANRFGHGAFTAPQLKVIQEIISVSVFAVFCVVYLREPITKNQLIAFALIVLAAWFSMKDLPASKAADEVIASVATHPS